MIDDPNMPLLERLYTLDLEQDYQGLIDFFASIIARDTPGDIPIVEWSECFRLFGRACRMMRQFDKALQTFQKAALLFPHPSSRIHIALCYLDMHDYGNALSLLDDLLTEEEFGYGYFLRGQAEIGLRRYTAAATSFAQAAHLQPDQPELLLARLNLARERCDWDRVTELSRTAHEWRARIAPDINPVLLEATACPLDHDDPDDQKLLSESRSLQLQHTLNPKDIITSWPKARAHQGRLRIGYLSANFAKHPGAMLMRGIFGHHDRTQIEVFGYALTEDDGSIWRRDAMRDIEHFRDLSQSGSQEAAQIIHEDGIQVLIDMKGWTENNRQDILALRPAPVQISYLGYAAPMIAPWIDYQIVDPVLVPPDTLADYGTTVIMLPDCYQPNDRERPIPTGAIQRGDVGLPDDAVVLSCFNSPYKITRPQFDLWMQILHARPQTILWLLVTSDDIAENLANAAARHKIAPQRIIMAPALPLADHIDRLSLADLALDTFPYGGHTTTSEALWAGVPVVTMQGRSFASRVAASLLNACHLSGLITETPDAYRQLALDMIDDPAQRTALKAHLTAHRDQLPLFDTAGKAHMLEQAYQAAWAHYLEDQPPQHILFA